MRGREPCRRPWGRNIRPLSLSFRLSLGGFLEDPQKGGEFQTSGFLVFFVSRSFLLGLPLTPQVLPLRVTGGDLIGPRGVEAH